MLGSVPYTVRGQHSVERILVATGGSKITEPSPAAAGVLFADLSLSAQAPNAHRPAPHEEGRGGGEAVGQALSRLRRTYCMIPPLR